MSEPTDSMKLIHRQPRWTQLHGWASEAVYLIGLTFRCPHCECRLAIPFDNPIDPTGLRGTLFQHPIQQPAWQRSGDTFETLTLSPSIDVAGHWHGHITNGELVTT